MENWTDVWTNIETHCIDDEQIKPEAKTGLHYMTPVSNLTGTIFAIANSRELAVVDPDAKKIMPKEAVSQREESWK